MDKDKQPWWEEELTRLLIHPDIKVYQFVQQIERRARDEGYAEGAEKTVNMIVGDLKIVDKEDAKEKE